MSSFPITYSSRRTPCPKCEARHAWAAIIEYGSRNVEGLGYGVCKACGFLHTPKHEKKDARKAFSKEFNKESFGVQKLETNKQVHPSYERRFVDADTWQATLAYTRRNNFARFACRTFGDAFLQHLDVWGVGGDAWGSVVWNYFDWQGRCCTMKTMPYNAETGKRVKEGLAWHDYKTGEYITASAVNGLRTRFDTESGCSSFQWFTKSKGYELCLYGEQWLSLKSEATVIIVESEKTAVIGSFIFPDYVWIAAGGTSGLTKEKAVHLRERTVLVCFDAEEKAIVRAQQTVVLLRGVGAKAIDTVHDKPIIYALLGEENSTGKDIADELIEYFCAYPSARFSAITLEERESDTTEVYTMIEPDSSRNLPLPVWLDRYEFEERAAIMEFDGGISHAEVEQQALQAFQQERTIFLASLSEVEATICTLFSATSIDECDDDYIFIAEL